MKHLLIILSILLLSSPLFGQSEKPQTIIIPTGSLGDISKTRIRILEKTLESKLDDHFAIVPKEIFEGAKEKAFEELEYNECTEDQCIMKIQELLQVENAFKMELIIDEGDTQISITWNDQNQKRVEENFCKNCGTFELREMIGGLVEKLVGVKDVFEEELPKKVEPVVVERPVVVVEKKQKGVLYYRQVNGEMGYHKDGDEKWNSKYVGEIVNGVPDGQGVHTTPDGIKMVGEFRGGQYWNTIQVEVNGEIKSKIVNGILYNEDGNILGKFVNGVLIPILEQ